MDQPESQSPEDARRSWHDEALRLTQERFGTLGGLKNCGVILLDPAGCVASWNEGAEIVNGYQPDEMLGRHFSCFFPAEDVAEGKPQRELAAAFECGKVEEEGWRIRRDGSRFYANVLLVALRDENGELRGYSKVVRDLTDRKTEASLRSVLDNVIDGIITINEQGLVESFNPAAERIFGYLTSEVLGQNVKMLMPEPYHGEHDGYLANFLDSGQAKIIGIGREVVGRRKDGSTFPLDLAVSTFCLEGHRFFTGIVRDITDRKRMQLELKQRIQELAQAEERMRSVVNHVVDGIITIDDRGEVQSFNPAAERIFGYLGSEVIGRNVKMLMPEPYHGEHDGYVANYLDSGQAKIIGIGREVVGRRKDATTFPMDLAVSEFHLGQRRFFTGIVRDITERKRLEQELRQRLAVLAESDRRKDHFLATLAHELRNPLAPIVTAMQLLNRDGATLDDLQWARGVIDRQVIQMVHLIDDLLDVSRITRG